MFMKKGFTLLEVLISAMVIMVGILGVATLIPASKYQINEAVKADMAATIGRSALKTMITQNWMVYLTDEAEDGHLAEVEPVRKNQTYWFNWGEHSHDSEGDHAGEGGAMVADFHCTNDLVPDPSKYTEGEDPPYYDTSLHGKFEWSGTIRKIEPSFCEISAAVSYQRGESVEISSANMLNDNDLEVTHTGDYEFRPGEWIYVSNSNYGHWYKIIQLSAGDNNKLYFTIQGPRWGASGSGGGSGEDISGPPVDISTPLTVSTRSNSVSIATPGNVIAVYTEVVPCGIR
ncbi:MAG: prepilin-type N-terminal cleavage/methylation domain-containing protein [Planctomycetia bacterium]|nr:prepilin-type N-terminal cleavage/methylation domain-containing protein [Planctomycetia bacterium]